jgi:nicotinate phosphoribosyltransferase
MKESSGKKTYPGRKQIFRSFAGGNVKTDRLGLVTESQMAGEQPLLQLVMKQGKSVQPPETLAEIRERTAATVASLADECRRLDNPVAVRVELSAALQELTEKTRNEPQRRRERRGRE